MLRRHFPCFSGAIVVEKLKVNVDNRSPQSKCSPMDVLNTQFCFEGRKCGLEYHLFNAKLLPSKEDEIGTVLDY